MDFEQVLKEVVWRLVTEGRISYRRIKLSFALDDDGLEELRRELIGLKRLAADVDGELLVWAPEGRAARPEPVALPQPLPALRHAEKPVALPPVLSAPAATPAVAAAPEAERRQLTVMFCDLVGSTALSTGMDPEDLRDVIASFQNRCSAAIRHYDGFVAKYMGDGILVYFGYPRAHEDEAERSVRAGLDIVEAMSELNAAVQRPPGVELAVRIGIATGPVIVGDQIGEGTASETAVVGETPNLAARLQALARPNQIVVSAAPRAMLGDHFDLEDLGTSELKGFAEPVPVWRVLSARDVESRFAATRTGSSAPLVGRQEEMGLLLRAWESSCHGRGQVVLIQGEAGVGKSRLVEGLREAAGKDHIWVAIRCSPFHTASAFHPIVEHLKRVFSWQPEDTAQQHLAKLEAGLTGFRALPLSESVRLFADLMSVPAPENRFPRLAMTAQQQRDATLDAIIAWLIETAERAPVLMAWEDLHWADPTTLEALGMLIEQAPTAAMLVVATYRPELTPPWPQRSHMTPITLNRLERPEVETMVIHLAGGRALPGEVVDRERAERELDLQMALGPALYATKGYGDPDIGRTYARALELCRRLDDYSRESTSLRGLQLHHQNLLEMEKAQHFAEEALRVAERLGDPARLVGAHMALGSTLYFQGKLEPALAQFRRGFELFDPNMQFPDWPGSHPGVQCQYFPMLISWMLGYSDRSLDELRAAIRNAETLGHSFTLAHTLCYAAFVHIFRHEPSAAADYAGRALRICEEQRIAQFHAVALCVDGWALAVSGESEKGLAQIGQGLDGYGLGASQHMLLALQADAQLAIGKPEAALASVAAGLKAVEKMGGAPLEAELYRLRGEALLAGAGTVSEAEATIEKGIDVARRQNAKSWELRGAMSLARLRRQQGRPQEAVALLAPILAWFTEGLDTADLKEAKTLLDKLTEPAIAAEG